MATSIISMDYTSSA